MRRPVLRRLVLVAAIVPLLGSTGCFGSFQLTRKFYAFNKNISPDKWVQELFFVATAFLVPVYGVASLIDVVFLNTMEFWGQPVSVDVADGAVRSDRRVLEQGDVTVVQTMTETGEARTMILEESRQGQFVQRTTLVQRADDPYVTATTVTADGRATQQVMLREADGSHRVLRSADLLK